MEIFTLTNIVSLIAIIGSILGGVFFLERRTEKKMDEKLKPIGKNMKDIENQVYNHLPTQIKDLGIKIDNNQMENNRRFDNLQKQIVDNHNSSQKQIVDNHNSLQKQIVDNHNSLQKQVVDNHNGLQKQVSRIEGMLEILVKNKKE